MTRLVLAPGNKSNFRPDFNVSAIYLQNDLTMLLYGGELIKHVTGRNQHPSLLRNTELWYLSWAPGMLST